LTGQSDLGSIIDAERTEYMKKIERILSRTFLMVFSALFIFVLLELVTNCYLLYFASEKNFVKYASMRQLQARGSLSKPRYSPHRYLGYYPTPNYVKGLNRHNSLGYRGEEISIPKPPGQIRIVCLGGSTTYTYEIEDYKKSYPYLLEEYLHEKNFDNIEVINAGSGGWSSWESLINLQLRVLDLDPDIIIIYHGINDIHPRLVWPPEVYRGDNSGRRAPNETTLFMPSIFEHSTLLRILMIRTGMTASHAAFERTIDRKTESYYGIQFRKQKMENNYPDGIFKEVSAKKMLEINRPIYFERNIRNMVTIAKAAEIKVVISSFAHSPLFTDQPFVSSEEYALAYKENNGILKEIAKTTGVHFFDFAGKFPSSKRYYTDGRHVNEEGSQLKAQLFGDFLIENQLVTSSQE
jgi:lysophospholipase L1-like esterase